MVNMVKRERYAKGLNERVFFVWGGVVGNLFGGVGVVGWGWGVFFS